VEPTEYSDAMYELCEELGSQFETLINR